MSATISVLVLNAAGIMKGLAMKSILGLLAAIALGVGICAGTGQADPPQKAEGKKEEVKPAQQENLVERDDPLPAGSTLRFGTSRFRHGIGISTMAVAADGKLAVAVNGNHSPGATRVFDLVSGRALYSLGGREGTSIEAAAFSPDGQTIVTKQDFSLRVRDAATGKELRKIDLQRPKEWSTNEWVAFTPDGKALAVTSQGGVIHLIDLESGRTIRDFSNANPEHRGWESVLGIAFAADGKLLASGGFTTEKGTYFARLWDVATGKELRRFMHSKQSYGIPSLAFSPDAKTLATRSHDGRLRLFEVDTGKERHTFPADGGGRKLGAVAFAPDGRTVAAAGDSIRLYDVTNGEERLRIDRSQASDLHFTDGGQTLTAAVDGAIYRWDTTSGKVLTPEAGDSAVEQVLVSADGSRVVTRGVCADAHLWDGTTGQHLRRFQAGWMSGMAISPDGRFLAWPVDDANVTFADPQEPGVRFYGSRIRFYDIAAGKTVDRIPTFKGAAQDLAFIADGKKLVIVDRHPGMVRIWDFAGAKEERRFPIVLKAKEKAYIVVRTALSPDGTTAVVTYQEDRGGREFGGLRGSPQHVQFWDVATGKELPRLSGGHPVDRAFSPGGRFVVTRGRNGVCEVATGNWVATWPDELHIRAAAFSRDGRFLATAAGGGVIQIWEVATWTRRNEFKDDNNQTTTLTFAPSGQLLSGNQDTTVLAWDMRPPRVAGSVTLASAWNDLARREAAGPFQSEGRFLEAPADAVKFFAERIKPAEALDPKRVERLLADLGSNEFAVRQAASKALAGLNEQATPYLEKTLQSPDSEEVRLRVTRILEQRRGVAITADQIRQIRAVMVLERIGDSEAKDLLKRWAGGPVGARLTTEAAAALRRLETVLKVSR